MAPVGGALTNSGTVHMRSVAVLRQTHPGGTFAAQAAVRGQRIDESRSKRRPARPSRDRTRLRNDDAFTGKGPGWFDARFAYDEHVAGARAATAARSRAAGARGGGSQTPGARLPARLRPEGADGET